MSGDDNGLDGVQGGEHDGGEPLESLQERLTARGRKLVEAAQERGGALAGEATGAIGGFVEQAGERLGFGGAADDAAAAVEGHVTEGLAAGGAAASGLAAEGLAAEGLAAGRLDLEEPARLPWLESADDDDDYDDGVDSKRVALFVGAGLALLAAIVGGIWWTTHRNDGAAQVADGSLIKAPTEPYKTAPADPGGKTYEGTGDTSFAVSQGKSPTPNLAADAATGAGAAAGAAGASAGSGAVKTAEQAGAVAMAAAKAAGGAAAGAAGAAKTAVGAAVAAAPAAVAGSSGGYGVQVGAYTSEATAEAGWAKLQKAYAPLGGMRHRIVQGQADIGTVYRLQAVTDSDGAAASLCSAMKAHGLACQVKK